MNLIAKVSKVSHPVVHSCRELGDAGMPADSGPAPTTLVAGATGYLGGFVVRELLRLGVPVRALVRPGPLESAAAAELAAAGADIVACDATQPGALVGICDGCGAVVSCLAADMRWSSGTPESVDRDANIALFQEAAGTTVAGATNASSGSRSGNGSSEGGGVRYFMLVATFEGREAKALVPLHRAKEVAVDHIQQLAGDYGITYTILRPTAYFNDFTGYPWARMQSHSWMVVPGGGWSRYNPIDGAELAAFVADCVRQPGQYANAEVRIGGPEVLTFRDTILAAAEAQGKQREQVRLIPLPVALLRLLAAVFGLLGLLWPSAAHTAGALRFVIYATTHDSVGMQYGTRTVAQHYRELRQKQLAAGGVQAAAGAGPAAKQGKEQ